MKSCPNEKCEKYGIGADASAVFCEKCGTRIVEAPQENAQNERQRSSEKLLNMTIYSENIPLKIFLDNNMGYRAIGKGEGIKFENLSPGTHSVMLKGSGLNFFYENSFEIKLEKDTNLTFKLNNMTGKLVGNFTGVEYFVKKSVGWGMPAVIAFLAILFMIFCGIMAMVYGIN